MKHSKQRNSKAFQLSQKIMVPILNLFPEKNNAHPATRQLIAVWLLIILCFVAGLFALGKRAKKMVSKIDDNILSHVPGYIFLKKTGQGALGITGMNNLKVMLAKVDDAWQIAFMTEQINDVAIFIPDAPSPLSGAVYYIEKDRMRFVDILQKQALNSLTKLGFGSAAMLKGKL